MGKAAQLTPAFLGALAEFEHHMQHAVPAKAALGALGSMPDRSEGAFNGVRCADALPVLGWEIVESEQLVAILDQAFGGFGVFRPEGFDEQIEGFVGVLAGLGLPNVMQHFLGLGLGSLGQVIQGIACLMHPAALLAGCWEDFFKCGPEPHGTIASGQFGCFEPTVFQAQRNRCAASTLTAQRLICDSEASLICGEFLDGSYKRVSGKGAAPCGR